MDILQDVALYLGGLVLLVFVSKRIFDIQTSLGMERIVSRMHEAFNGACTPMRIKLTPIEEGKCQWNHWENIRDVTQVLCELGFEIVGDYQVYSNSHLNIRSFIHPEQCGYAVADDRDGFKSSVVFSTIYTDGTAWNYLASRDIKHPVPPWSVRRYFPHQDIASVWQRFLEERPNENMRWVSRENFALQFEANHARNMDWLAERGGFTDEELREMLERETEPYAEAIYNYRLKKKFKNPAAEERIAAIQELWREHFRRHFESRGRAVE